MGFDTVYSYLIDSAVVFLSSWVIFLLVAYATVFGRKGRSPKG